MAAGWGVGHMVAAPRISQWGLRTAVAHHTAAAVRMAAARMAAGEAATTAEMAGFDRALALTLSASWAPLGPSDLHLA